MGDYKRLFLMSGLLGSVSLLATQMVSADTDMQYILCVLDVLDKKIGERLVKEYYKNVRGQYNGDAYLF